MAFTNTARLLPFSHPVAPPRNTVLSSRVPFAPAWHTAPALHLLCAPSLPREMHCWSYTLPGAKLITCETCNGQLTRLMEEQPSGAFTVFKWAGCGWN